MEHVELLPTREALAFDIFRWTNVQGVNMAGQSNTAGALLGALAGNQLGSATANQGIVVNQL
jgi:hypothetical protein